jgi:hypothetical protein
MNKGYWFTANIFEITTGEDEATNPGCYGKNLAEWLCKKFKAIGYTNAEVVPEDWGWCVVCSTNEVTTWIGCGVAQTEDLINSYDPTNPPKGSEVVWHVFAQAEVPIFKVSARLKKLMGKISIQEHEYKLAKELALVLSSEPSIFLCQEP